MSMASVSWEGQPHMYGVGRSLWFSIYMVKVVVHICPERQILPPKRHEAIKKQFIEGGVQFLYTSMRDCERVCLLHNQIPIPVLLYREGKAQPQIQDRRLPDMTFHYPKENLQYELK